MSNGGGIIIICKGVVRKAGDEVTCKKTTPLPFYPNGMVCIPIDVPNGLPHDEVEAALAEIRVLATIQQRIIARLTRGVPYSFEGDVNALPECGP